MSSEFLYSQSETLIAVSLLALLLGGAEAGYRIGRRRQSQNSESAKSRISAVQSATLALLGLLLGFTIGTSISRYDGRKKDLVNEVNAIGTAALRARLLPAPERGEAVNLIRRYVDNRLESSHRSWDPELRNELDQKASQVHEQLWLLAAAVAKKEPQNFTTGLFIQAVNEVIDAKGSRDAGLDNHVPETVLFLLLTAAVLGVGMVGYVNGIAGHRATVVTAMLSVLFGLTIFVIVDLDRPRRGLIQVSQKSMIELKNSLDKPPA